MRKFLSKEFIFEAIIDFGHQTRDKEIYLVDKPESFDNIKVPTRTEVAESASKAISVELPEELENIYGIKIKTRIIATRYDSLHLFFGAILTGYTLIGGYKSFLDSVDLIKRHANSILRKRFKEEWFFSRLVGTKNRKHL